MSTFNDAARVSRQKAQTSAKLQNTQIRLPSLVQGSINSNKSKTGRELEPEVNRSGVHSRHASTVKSNGSGNKQLGNEPERSRVSSNGKKINLDVRRSVLGSKLIHSQGGNRVDGGVGNLSHSKGNLIQSRNGNKGGIDPSYFGISVKPKTVSVKSKTGSTLMLPTAETNNDDIEYGGYQPEDELYNYNEEEDNDEAYSPEYLDFVAQQRKQRETVDGPRVEIYGGAEPCSCFPHRSDKNLPSMVYEKLKCKHSHVKGEAHAGVYRFDINWNEQYEDSAKKKTSQPPPKTKFVFGYPKPTFLEISGTTGSDENGDAFYEGEEYEGDEYWDYYNNDNGDDYLEHVSERYTNRIDENDDVLSTNQNDYRNTQEQSRKAKNDTKTKSDDYVSGLLPQIGYSPPQSRDMSRLSVRSRPYSLPALPDSPYLSAKSVKRIKSVQSIRTDDDYADATKYGSNIGSRGKQDAAKLISASKAFNKSLETPRRFKGKYYDSGM